MPFYQSKKQVEFTVSNFKFESTFATWESTLTGVNLGESQTGKKVWLPLDFLKINDEIVSYELVGDATETTALTLDCKLVKVNKADPLTTTDISGGAITQIITGGNFDAAATLAAVETVATDKQYVLEINGTTGIGDTITVIGAEVKVNRI